MHLFHTALRDALEPHGIPVPEVPVLAGPISLRYLLANAHTFAPKTIQLSPQVHLEFANRSLHADGEVVELTEKEVLLLSALAQHPKGLSRDALLAQVWAYAEGVDTHTLETHVHRLRAKLKNLPAAESLITTTTEGYGLLQGQA